VGNYTEKDIKEAARAFIRLEPRSQPARGSWTAPICMTTARRLSSADRQFPKRDIVDIILQQPACSHFIARNLSDSSSRRLLEEFRGHLAASLGPEQFESLRSWSRFSLSGFLQPAAFAPPDQAPCAVVVSITKSWESPKLPPIPQFAASPARSDRPSSIAECQGLGWRQILDHPSTIFQRENTARYILFPEEMAGDPGRALGRQPKALRRRDPHQFWKWPGTATIPTSGESRPWPTLCCRATR